MMLLAVLSLHLSGCTKFAVSPSVKQSPDKFSEIKLPANRNMQIAGKCEVTETKLHTDLPKAVDEANFHEPKKLFKIGADNYPIQSPLEKLSFLTGYAVGEFKKGPYKNFTLILAEYQKPDFETEVGEKHYYRFAYSEKEKQLVSLSALSHPEYTLTSQDEQNPDAVEIPKNEDKIISTSTIGKMLAKQKVLQATWKNDDKYAFQEFLVNDSCLVLNGIALKKTDYRFDPTNSTLRSVHWDGSEIKPAKPILYLTHPVYGKIYGKGYFYEMLFPDGTIASYAWSPPVSFSIETPFGAKGYDCFMRGGKREADVPITQSVFTNAERQGEDTTAFERSLSLIENNKDVGPVYRLKKPNGDLLGYEGYRYVYRSNLENLTYQRTFDKRPVAPGEIEKVIAEELRAPLGTLKGRFTLKEFHKLDPTVFVRSAFGDFFECRQTFYYQDSWAEPLVYLYSSRPTQFQVSLSPLIHLDIVRPKINERTWTVVTRKDGHLQSLDTGEVVPYLFWEGDVAKGQDDGRGFSVSAEESIPFLKQKLKHLGLSAREINDFLKYWADYAHSSPYFFMRFLSEEQINLRAPLIITPKPDTSIRVSLHVSPENSRREIEPQSLPLGKPRKGNVMVEWGIVPR